MEGVIPKCIKQKVCKNDRFELEFSFILRFPFRSPIRFWYSSFTFNVPLSLEHAPRHQVTVWVIYRLSRLCWAFTLGLFSCILLQVIVSFLQYWVTHLLRYSSEASLLHILYSHASHMNFRKEIPHWKSSCLFIASEKCLNRFHDKDYVTKLTFLFTIWSLCEYHSINNLANVPKHEHFLYAIAGVGILWAHFNIGGKTFKKECLCHLPLHFRFLLPV